MRVQSALLLAVLCGAIGVASCAVEVDLPFDGATPTPTLLPCELTVPVETKVLYVSPAGNDANTGTQEAPFRTIARALTVAPLASEDTVIFVQGGGYPEGALTIEPPHLAARIYGGFSGDWTTRDEIAFATTLQLGPLGLRIIGNASVPLAAHLDGLFIVTGTSGTVGGTSYGIFARRADVTLNCVELHAGNGRKGADAPDGFTAFFAPPTDPPPLPTPSGSNGGPGGAGCAATRDGGNGGNGASGGMAAFGGLPGDGGSGAAGGGPGSTGFNGKDGNDGASGSAGAGGFGGLAVGTALAGGWVGAAGGTGVRGDDGHGGGGGGGSGGTLDNGSGGGGGGGGGCGGFGGPGGGGGGGSIAVFLSDATLSGVNVVLGTGAAGHGGSGGTGTRGGNGGIGALGATSGMAPGMTGGTGGNGGFGGPGGGGGGGAGGMSVGIFTHDGASIGLDDDFAFALGSAGLGGPGGPAVTDTSGNPGETGAKGIWSERYP